MYRGIVVIQIVELDLYHLDLGILRQDLLQHLRSVVEGNAHMAHLPLLFQGKGRLISAAALKVLEDLRALGVHQIVIEIFHAAGGKLALKQRTDVLLLLEIEIGQLVGQRIPVAGITAGQTFLQRQLALALQIAVGGVEIGEARFQKGIHHAAGLRDVHFLLLHGQAHKAEAEISLEHIHRSFSFPRHMILSRC